MPSTQSNTQVTIWLVCAHSNTKKEWGKATSHGETATPTALKVANTNHSVSDTPPLNKKALTMGLGRIIHRMAANIQSAKAFPSH